MMLITLMICHRLANNYNKIINNQYELRIFVLKFSSVIRLSPNKDIPVPKEPHKNVLLIWSFMAIYLLWTHYKIWTCWVLSISNIYFGLMLIIMTPIVLNDVMMMVREGVMYTFQSHTYTLMAANNLNTF